MTQRSQQKRLFAAFAALAIPATASSVRAQLVPAGAGKQWANTWSTEFNNGAADLTGWSYDVGASGWGNNERQNYTAPAGSPAPTNNPFGLPGQQTTPAAGANN